MALPAMLEAATTLIKRAMPDAAALLEREFEPAPMPPASLPVCGQLDQCRPLASPATAELVELICTHHANLHWQQSYDPAAMPAGWAEGYGWFNLISPEGPFIAHHLRLSIGVWLAGLSYKPHHHPPEETYLVLAGEAEFWHDGAPPRICRAGETFHNAPDQMHSIEMREQPVMVLALWYGEALLVPSRFADQVAG